MAALAMAMNLFPVDNTYGMTAKEMNREVRE
jgi:hypothetical protein